MTAVGLAVLSVFATTATAAPLSWFSSQASLTAWYANQLNAAGNIYAPFSNSAVTNLPANWYASAPDYQAPAASLTAAPAPLAAQTVPAPTLTPVSTASFNSLPSASTTPLSPPVDAFINLGQGPYAEASTITTGTPQPWYTSPAAISAFGGAPTSAQQAGFADQVISDVQRTFSNSGINISLTDDPNTPARHMLSVVSGASYGPNPNAIGITDVGANGFGFIDKLSYATTPDQLAWAVAHNVSHELMHALGVASHSDTTGDYLDAAVANWSMLTDPNTRFSPAAVSLIDAALNGGPTASGLGLDGAQTLEAPVPEPSTVVVWMASALGAGFMARRRTARKAA
jgi:hypothetical protein